jgi:hypothetical protein
MSMARHAGPDNLAIQHVKPLATEKIKQVIDMTLHSKPPNATYWRLRSMAAAGLSYSSVQQIWCAHGLKPHLVKTFKVSRDKNFAAKVEDVVGLYLDPPDRALVFCIDEKSQIQALDRTQPGLPTRDGRVASFNSPNQPIQSFAISRADPNLLDFPHRRRLAGLRRFLDRLSETEH